MLRKDLVQKYNIAIDGPAGSGKSTVAKLLANDCHILYLDTGAMYRACALAALRAGIDVADEVQVCELMRDLALSVVYRDGVQHTLLGNEDVSALLRSPEVSMAASTISRHPSVRLKMVEKQREIAGKMSCVLDGRDIGTFVLPDADFKFYCRRFSFEGVLSAKVTNLFGLPNTYCRNTQTSILASFPQSINHDATCFRPISPPDTISLRMRGKDMKQACRSPKTPSPTPRLRQRGIRHIGICHHQGNANIPSYRAIWLSLHKQA